MGFLRALLLISLLVIIACSNKNSKPLHRDTPPNSETKSPEQAKGSTPTDAKKETPLQTIGEQFVDPYTSVLISELKNQLSNDSLSQDKRIQNVEFANRIFDVRYDGKNKLKITTHTDKIFNFQLTSTKKNVQYFNAYDNTNGVFNSRKRTSIYSAEAKTYKANGSKLVTIIKIKDLEANSIVHVIYVKKIGQVTSHFVNGYDYSRELTYLSKIFLDRTKENPKVIGEFYAIITEEKNISNASKFKLTISDNFTLESQPLVNHYRADQPHLIPLSVDYKSFAKTLFLGSAAYTAITDSSYVIESPRSPVELTALNLDLRVEAYEKIKGQKNSLPIRFFVKFK